MSKFYQFSQNNSGGRFVFDQSNGIAEYVIIEANSAEHANERALDIGLYFNGCSSGHDCPCCGDRWYEVNNEDASDEPTIYGVKASEYKRSYFDTRCFVHYLYKPFEKIDFKSLK